MTKPTYFFALWLRRRGIDLQQYLKLRHFMTPCDADDLALAALLALAED